MKITLLFLSGVSLLFCISCRYGASADGPTNNMDSTGLEAILQPGDILFQDLDCGPLCSAIEAVTQGAEGRNFSHCAMVVEQEDQLMLVEAIGNGVKLTPIKDFLIRSGDTGKISNLIVSRLMPSYQHLIPKATQFTFDQLGEPYDHKFIMNNGSWYCSELIYEAFKAANDGKEVFTLEPMTYKQPGTNDYFPAWVEYYRELHAEIPEGLPGINPGLISRSEKLLIVKNK